MLINYDIATQDRIENPVLAMISKLSRIKVPANTGVDKTTNRLVPSIAQQYIGNCISFNPGLLNLIMVAIKLIPPNIELPPSNRTLKIQIICPDGGVVMLKGG